ncbi:uncharacterized protein LOC116930281 [Daphnia magna]|uniref:uncharacterized protein LOC116930281 n=1 Tax=Daphnia magna TaxID=35525 RepID=UPI001E1BB687|nr:uncharacterized protein LOC116930281 [Daphnia magna]
MKKKKSFDDLDKANAALRLYYQTTELAAAGKRPRPENSGIQSEIDDHQVGRGRRTPKPRDIYSPPSSPSIGGNKRSGLTTIRCTKRSYDTFQSPANRFRSSKRVHPPNINVVESVFDSSPLEKKVAASKPVNCIQKRSRAESTCFVDLSFPGSFSIS